MHIAEIGINILTQLIFFCVNIFAISLIVDKLSEWCLYLCSPLYVAFAAIGTPFHETSHALMCLLFGHKIYEFKPLSIEADGDGICFGRISHGYREGGVIFRLYQTLGNYYIGTAPVVFCSGMIMLAMLLLLPDTFSEMGGYVVRISELQPLGADKSVFFGAADIFFDAALDIGKGAIGAGWLGALFVTLVIAFSLNMSMSFDTDFIFSLKSVPLLVLVTTLFNFALGFADFDGYMQIASIINVAGLALFFTMVLALAVTLSVTLIILFVGLVIKAMR